MYTHARARARARAHTHRHTHTHTHTHIFHIKYFKYVKKNFNLYKLKLKFFIYV